MKNNRTIFSAKRLGILVAALIGLGAIFAILEITGATSLISGSSTPTPVHVGTADQTPNYTPPTKDEKVAGDIQKETIVKNETQAKPPSTANVVIVDASQYDNKIEVRALVTNVFQDGECTVDLTSGTEKVTKTVTAFKDATTTQCTSADFDRSQFTRAGVWQVSVRFVAGQLTGEAVGTLEIK